MVVFPWLLPTVGQSCFWKGGAESSSSAGGPPAQYPLPPVPQPQEEIVLCLSSPLAWEPRPLGVGVEVASGGGIRSGLVAQGPGVLLSQRQGSQQGCHLFLGALFVSLGTENFNQGTQPQRTPVGHTAWESTQAWLPPRGATSGNDNSSNRRCPGAHLLLPRSQGLCGRCIWEAVPWGRTASVLVERGPTVAWSCGGGRGRGQGERRHGGARCGPGGKHLSSLPMLGHWTLSLRPASFICPFSVSLTSSWELGRDPAETDCSSLDPGMVDMADTGGH